MAQAVKHKMDEAETRFGATTGDPLAYLGLGNVASSGKNYLEALKYFDKAIAVRPDYAAAWDGRGYALLELKRYEEAVASYDKALAIDPQSASAGTFRKVASLYPRLAALEKAMELRQKQGKQ